MGADLLDPLDVVRASLAGRRFTPYTSIFDDGDPLDHNLSLLADVLDDVIAAIEGGYLRELVEATAPLTIFGTVALRHLDRGHHEAFEAYAPVFRRRVMRAGDMSLHRPEVVRFRTRVMERFVPPPYRALLVLPCSARKPYSRSPTHRRIIEVIESSGRRHALQELILTSPLGLVPRELETAYPASAYDTPVTGHWSADEREMLTALLMRWVETHRYDHVLLHLPPDMDFVREAVPDAEWTAVEGPATGISLERLARALSDIDVLPVESPATARFRSAVSFHFPSASWLEPFRVRGREAIDGEILLRLTERPHLTLAGGGRLAASGLHTVEIDDFRPRGSVLAPGVLGCSDHVRPGDEVVVVHEGEVRAVGRALMGADEMVGSDRGIAVKVKSHI